MSHEFSDIPMAQTGDSQREANPYASPLTLGPLLAEKESSKPVGIWCADSVLIVHRAAALPMRCISTNAQCDASERCELVLDSRRTSRIAQASIGAVGGLCSLGFLFSNFPDRQLPAAGAAVLALLLIALFTLRKAPEHTLSYYVSRRVHARRMRLRNAGVFFFIAGLFTLILPAGLAQLSQWLTTTLIVLGLLMMTGGGSAFVAGRFPLRVERPSSNYLLIHGCGREFLSNFPRAAIVQPFLGQIFPKPFE
jgi:hypothetical protein